MTIKKAVRLLAIGLILGAMFAVSSQAATITFTAATDRPTSYGGGYYGGGEFNALVSGGTIFQTFCLEMNEGLSFGTPYAFNVGMEAVNGGVAGGSPDPISSQTAYLYTNFFHDTLAGYTSASDQQIALQYAIWYFEEAVDLAAATAAGAEPYITLANANADGFYDVQVINPYVAVAGAPDIQKQSVLFVERVPEAGALLLFGSGLIGLIGYRRTRRMK